MAGPENKTLPLHPKNIQERIVYTAHSCTVQNMYVRDTITKTDLFLVNFVSLPDEQKYMILKLVKDNFVF